MHVLVVNAGSSSLKHALVDAAAGELLATGTERWAPADEPGRHAAALRAALADADAAAVDAVGHRVVHGGSRFEGPALVDAAVRAGIAALVPLAPLHQRAALEGIDAVAEALPGVPQVASFDTAFHATLPPAARTYALPRAWTERWGVRRYGFHGINVSWCARRAAECLGPVRSRRLVVCHLGSGCSATAVLDGRSVDTTMGFTPLEGVPMGTRSGSIDPGLLLWLARAGLSIDELDDGLNHAAGLLGVSGRSADLREVLAAADAGDEHAALAFDVFVRGVARAVAAMTTALGGLDCLVFTGGAGEGSQRLRDAVCVRIAHLRDAAEVLVVPAGEELVIAGEAAATLGAVA
ncbi:MAG TPA: acetate/propionate family kinase [Capillimicrobium sp.]|nr:acetate/propionate family kinase [Capillimicrobium sp.]